MAAAELVPGTQKFAVTDLDVASVVVYPEMAEVRRTWKCAMIKGINEVVVENLSRNCLKDSVRVNGYGSSSCTILEVQYQTKFRDDKKAREECLKEADKVFNEKLDKLNDEVQSFEDEQKRVQRKREFIDGIASNLMVGSKDEQGLAQGHSMDSIKPESVENLVSFMTTHENQLTQCDIRLREIAKLLTELKEQVTAMKTEQKAEHDKNRENSYENRQVLVKIECTEDCDTQLGLIYHVSQARWSPKYDIRADSSTKKVKLIYYAVVNQTTGEEWNDVALLLSTARASFVKSLPKLPTMKVDYGYADYMKDRVLKSAGLVDGNMEIAPARWMSKKKKKSKRRSSDAMNSYFAAGDSYDGAVSEDDLSITLELPTTQVSSGVLSATYEIQNKSSISSGNTEHKVTVATVELDAVYEHKCIPKITGKALLTAKLRNTSPYLLLPGPSSIFLDNGFVTDSTLQAVSPNEEFSCLLGMDEAVKINYKPKQKFKERSGILTKIEVEKYKQIIHIKNTKPISIQLQVQEQLPVSYNEQIKVNVIAPTLPKEGKNDPPFDPYTTPVFLNSSNNIVWNIHVKPGKTETLTLSYNVEKPANSRPLEFYDV